MSDIPKVSLVIPIRNEQQSLSSLYRSICEQTHSPDEIILVDGGSSDSTVSLARQLTLGDRRFRLIEAGPATPGRGRNIGIAAASFEWIALTDAGIQLEPQWLACMLEILAHQPDTQVVYGNFEPMVTSFFERCAAFAYVPPKQNRPGGKMRGPSVASALLQKSVWAKVGGFPDLRAAEDLIFMEHVAQAGFKIKWAPKATVHWQLQPTLATTFNKFTNYSRHNVLAGRQRYWHYGILRQYLFNLPFLVLALFFNPLWLIVPLLWLCARISKSTWQKRDEHASSYLVNPFQFLLVGVILLTLDLATFLGWFQAQRNQGSK